MSLSPQFQPGDFVIVVTWFSKRRLHVGDVIVFQQPGYELLIKRILTVNTDRESLRVKGDDPASIDSATFGDVPLKKIVGKILFHIPKGK